MPQSSKTSSSKKSSKIRSKPKNEVHLNSSSGIQTSNAGYLAAAPNTPLLVFNANNMFDSHSSAGGASTSNLIEPCGSKSHHKSYAGFEPRSVKIIWEQHDQTDVELSQEVCARVAEDASYKLWELINNIKVAARHSGGAVTYDLVNEVLRDSDVPPALGALDSQWDRVDYDGSFFFYTDKILELRDEYQKAVQIAMPGEPDFLRSWILDDKHLEDLRKYIPSLVYVLLHGEQPAFDEMLKEAAASPIIPYCYRVLLVKIIQILAFKQANKISERCWQVLRACSVNPYVLETDCREEFFHLSEILVCQLLGPLECIKTKKNEFTKIDGHASINYGDDINNVTRLETQIKVDSDMNVNSTNQLEMNCNDSSNEEKLYKLQPDENEMGDITEQRFSSYFASPVDIKFVPDLCITFGHLAAQSGYFQTECTFLIKRRLEHFFQGRIVCKLKEYTFVGRAVNGLTALGEYSFREFIPFIHQFQIENAPDSLRNEFALASVYLRGADDRLLYDWLENFCGSDKLQPNLTYYAEYYMKLMTMRFLQRKPPTYKITPVPGVRRLEWSTLAAAMCHGDDPNKAISPKPTIHELFPGLVIPNLNSNRPGNIRFKFAGCRPVILKAKAKISSSAADKANTSSNSFDIVDETRQHDILIAKRKLFKPLSNEKRFTSLNSFHYMHI